MLRRLRRRVFVQHDCLSFRIANSLHRQVHAVNYFNLVKNAGAVSVGVLGACRAISTFVISAVLFCERQSSQCFTVQRGMSSCIVSMGIVMYSSAKAVDTASKEKGGK